MMNKGRKQNVKQFLQLEESDEDQEAVEMQFTQKSGAGYLDKHQHNNYYDVDDAMNNTDRGLLDSSKQRNKQIANQAIDDSYSWSDKNQEDSGNKTENQYNNKQIRKSQMNSQIDSSNNITNQKSSKATEEINDYDYYASIDSQLGRLDPNYKKKMGMKQKSQTQLNNNYIVAMPYQHGPFKGKDLNETESNQNQNSLERDENYISFNSTPKGSASSKAKGPQVFRLGQDQAQQNEENRHGYSTTSQIIMNDPVTISDEIVSSSLSASINSSNNSHVSYQVEEESKRSSSQSKQKPQLVKNLTEKQLIEKQNTQLLQHIELKDLKSEEESKSSQSQNESVTNSQRHSVTPSYKTKIESKNKSSLLDVFKSKIRTSFNRSRTLMPKENKEQNELDSVEDVDVVKHNYSNDDDAKGEQMFEMEMKQVSEEEDVGTKVETDEVAKQNERNKLLNKPVAFMNEITSFYNVPVNYGRDKKGCTILPNKRWKLLWDFWIVFLLLVVCLLVPYQLAFYPNEDTLMQLVYYSIDFCFLIDMLFTFITAIHDPKTQMYITNKKIIAKSYLAFWFWIDLISIMPFDIISSTLNGNQLLRFAKIGKLYKIIRLSRLAKLFKLFKGQQAVFQQMSNSMQLSSGVERIVFIAICSAFFFHISACIFVFLAEFNIDPSESWRYDQPYAGYDTIDLYITSIYFVVTTMSTVGYGDISGGTTLERVFCIILMLIGVICFNLVSGALGALITNYDSSQASLNEKMLFLNNLRERYKITNELYFQIKKSLQYDHSLNMTGLDMFINELPANLRLEISEEIHRDNFSKMTWFQQIGNTNFRAWVASKLRPRFSTENTYMYQKGDIIDNFFFGVKGVFCFVIPEHKNIMYGVIDPVRSNLQRSKRKRVMQYFGCEDSIVNTTALVHDRINIDDCFKFSRNGINGLHKRFFTVQCVTITETLLFPFSEIDVMKRDFKLSSITFFHYQMQQTQKLLYFHAKALANSKQCQSILVKRTQTEKLKNQLQEKQLQSLEEENMEAVLTHIQNTNFNNFSDHFQSINFSKNTSSFHTLNTSQLDNSKGQKELEEKKQESDGNQDVPELPFDEFKLNNFDQESKSKSSRKGSDYLHSARQTVKDQLTESTPESHFTPFALGSSFQSKQRADTMPPLSQNERPLLKNHKSAQFSPNTAMKTQLDKISNSDTQTLFQTEEQKNNTFGKTYDKLNFTDIKILPRKTLKPSHTLKLSEMNTGKKVSGNLLDEKKRKKRRNKTYDREAMLNFKQSMQAQLLNMNDSKQKSVGSGQDQLQEFEQDIQSRNENSMQKRYPSYDYYPQLKKSNTNLDYARQANETKKRARASSVRLNSDFSAESLSQIQSNKDNILESSYTKGNSSKSKFDKNIIPELNLSQKQDKEQLSKRGLTKMIQIEDLEDRANSSERRDRVPSLRETISRLESGIMTEMPLMSRIRSIDQQKLQTNKTQTNIELSTDKADAIPPPIDMQLSKSQSVQHRRQSTLMTQWPLQRQHKKETELEFTRRLNKEQPRGIKGLAYVIMEIRRAIAEGIVKPKISQSPSKKYSGINKFATTFNKAASTKLQHTEKVYELLSTLEKEKMRVLDHLIKEQNFSNDESIIEKNEVFLDKIITTQKNQLDKFFSKIVVKLDGMGNQIGTLKGRIDNIQNDESSPKSKKGN